MSHAQERAKGNKREKKNTYIFAAGPIFPIKYDRKNSYVSCDLCSIPRSFVVAAWSEKYAKMSKDSYMLLYSTREEDTDTSQNPP